MGGGGGGGPFVNRSPEQFAQLIKNTEEETAIKAFDVELSGFLNELLASANSRNVDLVRSRLEEAKKILAESLERTIDSFYGGSVAKHTYVDGLSDIDTLLVLDGSDLDTATPSKALSHIAQGLKRSLPQSVEVSVGTLAVTLTYEDGMKIQLLPAFQTRDGLRVPSARQDAWSGISPEKFQKALTKRNEECGGKLVPTIKLAKAAFGALPDSRRLTGYHIESLAINAFKSYDGPKTLSAMLPAFFEKARTLVLSPIRDTTGQSVHVDAYLGAEGSRERQQAGHLLGRIAKRMRNASAYGSREQWEAMFRSDAE